MGCNGENAGNAMLLAVMVCRTASDHRMTTQEMAGWKERFELYLEVTKCLDLPSCPQLAMIVVSRKSVKGAVSKEKVGVVRCRKSMEQGRASAVTACVVPGAKPF